MPKVVDTKQRADEIANAVFTILCTEGLPAVTLSRVAEQTGLAIGSIRHYYPSHQQLVESALTLLIATISERIYRHYDFLSQQPADPHDQVVRILEELLPFDPYRYQEAVLWLRVMNEAVHDPTYRPYATKLSTGMREMIAQILQNSLPGTTVTELDQKVEGLSVFIDGLTVAMLSPRPTVTPKQAHNLLTRAVKTTVSSNNQIGSVL